METGSRSADESRAGVLHLDGGRLAYRVVGDGPAVVLVHGFSLDTRMWRPQIDALSSRYQVIAYDLRGFGASGPLDPAVEYTHPGDLVALLDHLGLDRVALAGFSFGGQVALRTACAEPSRVWALAVLDAIADGAPWDEPSIAAARRTARAAREQGVEAGRAEWLCHPLFGPAGERPEVAAALTAMVADYSGQHWLGLDPHPELGSPLDAAARLDVPTLVMVGERDVPGFRRMAHTFVATIPGASLVEIPGSGHLVTLEAPEAVTRALDDFLGKFV